MRVVRKTAAVVVIMVAAALCPGSGDAIAEEFRFDYHRTVDISGPVKLDLQLTSGSVVVTGTEEDRVVIDAVKVVRGSHYEEAEEVADHIEIKVRQLDRTVEIRTNYLKMFNRSRSFWQKVFGFGSGSGSYGRVEYHVAVPLNCCVKIDAISADILVENIEGELFIQNSSGITRAEFVFGPVTVRQPSGEIDLRWIEGDIRVKASAARIEIRQVRGAIDLLSESGDVTVQTELDSPKDYFVETQSGEIRFLVPEAASGLLRIESRSGEIATKMAVAVKSLSRERLVGEFGRGGPRIELVSRSGDVTVAPY